MAKPQTNKNRDNDDLVEEIKVFIEYSVIRSQRSVALQALENYKGNIVALHVLKDFYARLPEFRDEAVHKITNLVSRHSAYLLGVETRNYQYLYFFNEKIPVYLGEKKEGIGDSEVLNFFGFSDNKEFLGALDNRSHDYSEFKESVNTFCPVCLVEEGNNHLLGCPVEICPWCDSQLNMCNCRFDLLGVDELTEEGELDRLEVLLNEKGRIPFSADHAPSYPSAGDETSDEE